MSLSPARIFAALNAVRFPDQPSPIMGRAVVIGGSVAGLLTARVLADHAETVVVIDRDDLHGTGHRSGVPQQTQLHALLPGGFVQLERMFPGFRERALLRGRSGLPPRPGGSTSTVAARSWCPTTPTVWPAAGRSWTG